MSAAAQQHLFRMLDEVVAAAEVRPAGTLSRTALRSAAADLADAVNAMRHEEDPWTGEPADLEKTPHRLSRIAAWALAELSAWCGPTSAAETGYRLADALVATSARAEVRP